MTSYRDETIAGVERLEMHDFGQNPTVAVESALFDVARFGVAQLCNIGPELEVDDLQAMSLWAEKHADDDDGLIRGRADEINGRLDIFASTIKALFGKLDENTVAGIAVKQMCLRERKPLVRPDWHIDGQAYRVIATGIRAVLPLLCSEDNSNSSFLVSRLVSKVDADRDALVGSLRQLPISEQLSIPYSPRTAILIAEGTGGMRVVCPGDETIYGIESPMHAGWCDPSNPTTRPLLVVDGMLKKSKANNNAFVVPIPSKKLRLAS